jgi:hypothetical protein
MPSCYSEGFAEPHLGKSPAAMALTDIPPDQIMAFLNHLERHDNDTIPCVAAMHAWRR